VRALVAVLAARSSYRMKEIDPDIAALLLQARELRQESLALRPQIQKALANGDLAELAMLRACGRELHAQIRVQVDQASELARARYTLRGPTAI